MAGVFHSIKWFLHLAFNSSVKFPLVLNVHVSLSYSLHSRCKATEYCIGFDEHIREFDNSFFFVLHSASPYSCCLLFPKHYYSIAHINLGMCIVEINCSSHSYSTFNRRRFDLNAKCEC